MFKYLTGFGQNFYNQFDISFSTLTSGTIPDKEQLSPFAALNLIYIFKEAMSNVVLMDIDLPGMSGIEGTSRVKKLYPECVVLIITMFEDSEKVFQSLYAGAGGYIVKNSNVTEVLHGIDEAFAGGATMSLHIASMVVKSFKLSVDFPLSERETQVLQGIAQGKTYTKIAADLFSNKEIVRSHIRNIYQKLALNSKAEALRVAGNNQWIRNVN